MENRNPNISVLVPEIKDQLDNSKSKYICKLWLKDKENTTLSVHWLHDSSLSIWVPKRPGLVLIIGLY